MTLVTDSGRSGAAHMGISEGGPADHHSCLWANLLCDNQEVLTSLEIVGSGMSFLCNHPCNVAITGGVSQLTINNNIVDAWHSYSLQSQDQVSITANDNGLVSYVAIQGGFDIPAVFGSCTTVMRDGLGGLDGSGKPIAKGDRVPFKAKLPLSGGKNVSAPDDVRINLSCDLTLRLVEGYQCSDFTAVQRRQFYHRRFQINAQSNRMATRLDGQPLEIAATSLYSEGITKGAVQLPPEGLPIIMLSDRQTIGGYPKMGTVLSIDCDKLAQSPAGTSISFSPIDIHQAHNIICLNSAYLNAWRKQNRGDDG